MEENKSTSVCIECGDDLGPDNVCQNPFCPLFGSYDDPAEDQDPPEGSDEELLIDSELGIS